MADNAAYLALTPTEQSDMDKALAAANSLVSARAPLVAPAQAAVDEATQALADAKQAVEDSQPVYGTAAMELVTTLRAA